ncbi:MAG: exodeoxyribonuclease I, partial [Shewanella sp.]|nr:exodeoxyribonuclease I [Shewanella sp.]
MKMKDDKAGSIFWHDYETFGANPTKDRPSQLAGIRTDLDLNIIGEPEAFYCKQATDYLPSPE